jgi:hypothetical protein
MLATVVPAGNIAVNVAAAPGHKVPIAPKVGAGTLVTTIVRVVVNGQPFIVALKVII